MNILYLTNYMLEDVLKQRGNHSTFAQAANNKINEIREALQSNGQQVTVLSTALANKKSFKLYKGFKSKLDSNLYYVSILEFPLINTLSSIFFMCLMIFRLHKQKRVDYILFWNYKPEVALTALICKKLMNIKIILDYEDGYFSLHSVGKFKQRVFNYIEKVVSKQIDGAILISKDLISRIKHQCPYYILPGLLNRNVLKNKKKYPRDEIVTLMYAGGLDYERGIDILVDALIYTESDFKLKISGRGPLCSNLLERKDSRICYLGYLKYEETIKHLHQSDVLINPQRESIDFAKASFPSKVFDYLATDGLIISSNVGDMKDFSGGTFYIYENDDPKELARCIDEVIFDIKENRVDEKKKKMTEIREKYLPHKIGYELSNTLIK